MGQSWWPWALLVAGIACLPWVVKVLQRSGALPQSKAGSIAVLSACAVGPHQRVVTVRVAHAPHAVVLVLGVSPQGVECLHRWESPADPVVQNPIAAAVGAGGVA